MGRNQIGRKYSLGIRMYTRWHLTVHRERRPFLTLGMQQLNSSRGYRHLRVVSDYQSCRLSCRDMRITLSRINLKSHLTTLFRVIRVDLYWSRLRKLLRTSI